MAFDGITTACLRAELAEKLTGGRIYKIAQTDTDELVLTVKPEVSRGGGQVRLYLSADPSLPLCYLTQGTKPAPLVAPAFCMLLRKHIQNGKILSVEQPGLERILRFTVEHRNEMGDLCRHVLVLELMGKHSNLIFLSEDGVILDAIKRISSMVSSVREVLPGRTYFIPQTRAKREPLEETRESFLALLESPQSAAPVASFLSGSYTGLSNVMAEELCWEAQLTHERSAQALTVEERERLWQAFDRLMERVRTQSFLPTLYYKKGGGAAGVPQEYAAVPLTMYGAEGREFASMSELLETFYAEKNAATRIRQKSADLRRIVQTILERDVHKYDLQCRQMKDTEKRDKYRVYGELLNTYGYSIPEGAKSAVLDNYYTNEPVTVPLDPTLTPAQNARRYFDRYTKLKRTAESLSELTKEVKAEIDQLESIRTALELSENEGDLAQIRRELEECGFVRRRAGTDGGNGKSGRNSGRSQAGGKGPGRSRTPESQPLHYVSSDGYDMYVGKNNIQNDEISFRLANGGDLWFHANDIPGSHVIVKTNGKKMEEIPDRVFEEAASLAAYYSKGREQEKVEIDYLERRNLKKPGGAKPGFVVYYTNYSIIAGTDISGLRQV
ncbi:MAG: NFACT RNA binding domain-containing protein [Eubacteriales bacterium]|nr:NFACT RNA binding domain-containing protein [Eubacteriales bacterium]